MTAVAKTMTDDDLRAYSDHIATLPAAPPSTAGDSQQMARGAAVAQRSHCAGCHGQDYAGGKQVPRIARQREEYLRQTLEEFRQGKRIGYTPAMNEALAGISGPEIEDLAHYLAHRP
jgi:cytochrome c553